MIKIILVSLSLLLGFSGCSEKKCVPEIVTVTNTVYIDKPAPTLPIKPKARKYKVFILNLDGVQYYAVDRYNSAILVSNSESSKMYIKSLEDILKVTYEAK